MRYIALFGWVVLVAGCTTGRIDVYSCMDPCRECEHPCDPCPHGECVPLPPLGWDGPVLLWRGNIDAPQACPPQAPNPVYEGYDGLSYVAQCPPCSCGPAACTLPGPEIWDGPGCQGAATPYPLPDDWTGGCSSPALVPEASLGSVGFPVTQLSPCEPQEGTIVEKGDYHWALLARACQTTEPPAACDEATICVPTSEPPPPGFEQCIFLRGEIAECPLGYPNKRVFYSAIDTSSVGCTACACSPPVGGACDATLLGWSETGCAGSAIATGDISLTTPDCNEPLAGFDLASMEADWVQNIPGTCTASGGEPFGEAHPAEPATFCCQTPPAG